MRSQGDSVENPRFNRTICWQKIVYKQEKLENITEETNKMKRLTVVILCIIFPVALAHAQAPQPVQAGFALERELGSAEKHSYEVSLKKGELLNFVVEQRGVDIVLRIYAPDGKFYDRIDSPNGIAGDEPFRMVAFNDGRYRVEVNRYFDPDPTGKYFVKTVEIRKATNAEIKVARLKDELVKIATEETRFGSFPEVVKRRYANTALIIDENGFVNTAAELFDQTTKNPPKMPEGFMFEDELSNARVEDFGDTAVLNLNQSYNFKNPSENINRKVNQRIGYVFKRMNGEWRIINVQRTLGEPYHEFIKLDAKQLDNLVGVYEGVKPSETFTVLREGEMLFGKFGAGEKFPLTPESESVFQSGAFGVAFIRGADGAATQVVIHYPMPNDRISIQSKVK